MTKQAGLVEKLDSQQGTAVSYQSLTGAYIAFSSSWLLPVSTLLYQYYSSTQTGVYLANNAARLERSCT